jgi:hypothetical protein
MTSAVNNHAAGRGGGGRETLLERRAAKLACVAWVAAVTLLQWLMYGPYGPLQPSLTRARDLLLQFLSARYIF